LFVLQLHRAVVIVEGDINVKELHVVVYLRYFGELCSRFFVGILVQLAVLFFFSLPILDAYLLEVYRELY
jgi:hypothetical protein